ncbi:MAG: sugar ABC transporter permease [Alphaproteobacteria bacterium]|nr:sugar ABC transporter permease [Alphaproteobacteria bacterium]
MSIRTTDAARGEGAAPRAASDLVNATFRHWSLWPCLGFLLALSVYPVVQLVPMALSTIEFAGGQAVWRFTPRRNLDLLLADEVLRDAIVNTLVFVGLSVAIEMVLGFFAALFIACLPRGRVFARTIMILPILLPAVAIGSMWKLMYNYDFGLFNQIAGALGIEPGNWLGDTRWALLAVVVVDVWHWTPFVFLILFASIEALPQDVLEAARVDGASAWQMIRLIILPLLGPALAVAAIFRAIGAFKAFDQVYLLTSGGPGTATELVSLHLNRVFFEQNQLGYGAMLSLTIIAVIAATIGVARWAAPGGDRAVAAKAAP